MMSKIKKSKALPGYFVLPGKCLKAFSRSGQEIGILLNENYYLDIASLLKTPVSYEEARQYSKREKFNLPDKKLMKLLVDNLDVINNSLIIAGRGDCLLFGDITKSFWTQRAVKKESERRGVLFINSINVR